VLQSSLGSGQKSGKDGRGDNGGAETAKLVALAALTDARTASRIEQLALRLAGGGK